MSTFDESIKNQDR